MVKIVETTAGSITSTKQFIWCDDDRCEERDGSGSVTKLFFATGQRNGSTNFFYSKDHLGSVREMSDISGNTQASYDFDPFGVGRKLAGSDSSDFGFDGYYRHERSDLLLTVTRAYNAKLGRWLSRDTIEEQGGINLYRYVENSPLMSIDPSGLAPQKPQPLPVAPAPKPYKNCKVGDRSCCSYNRNRCNESCAGCTNIKNAVQDAGDRALYPTDASCRSCCKGKYNACINDAAQAATRYVTGGRFYLQQWGGVNEGCSQPGTLMF